MRTPGNRDSRHDHASNLPLTIWFLAFYLIGQAKTSISSLQLSRQLGVAYSTAWMLHSKIMHAMSDRDECYVGTPEKEMASRPGCRQRGRGRQHRNSAKQ